MYLHLIVVEIILLMGFVLLLFGANPSAGFTQWAYRNLDRVMSPFRGIFTPIELGVGGGDVPSTFETSVLFAMIVYGIVALVFSALIGWLAGRLDQVADAETELRRRAEYQAHRDELAAQQAAQAPGIRASTLRELSSASSAECGGYRCHQAVGGVRPDVVHGGDHRDHPVADLNHPDMQRCTGYADRGVAG